MAKGKKIEGGQGGKRGHSNMCHWSPTEVIKAESKRLRRQETKTIIAKALRDGN